MLTSVSNGREAKGLEGVSVDICLVKPVRQAKLVRTLVEAWARKQATANGASLAALSGVTAHPRAVERFAPSGVRVLVVEDNSVNQRVAIRLLERVGARADVAGSGTEALDMLKTIPYDFVFMDCQMPELDGYETTTRLRRMGGPNQGVRVIALTADVVDGCRERCLDAGMDDYLTKPVKLDDVIHVLKDRLVPEPATEIVS
jgi:CheY-like chemotaxis protein